MLKKTLCFLPHENNPSLFNQHTCIRWRAHRHTHTTLYLFFPSDSRKKKKKRINGYVVKVGLFVHDPLKYKLIKIYLASDLQSNVEPEASCRNRPSEDLSDLVEVAVSFCLF